MFLSAIGIVLGLIGIVLGFIGVALTFVTFFSPSCTFRYALGKSKEWQKVPHNDDNKDLYRHRILSGFTIEVDYSKPVVDNFNEPWMEVLYRPDLNAASYNVFAYLNGIPLLSELFLSYDGGRNFIPCPKLKKQGKNIYLYFDEIQKKIAGVVGRTYRDATLDSIYSDIIGSKYNPLITSYPDISTPAELERLDRKISDFKRRIRN